MTNFLIQSRLSPPTTGMVDHTTLHDAFARAGFILYPTAFPGKKA